MSMPSANGSFLIASVACSDDSATGACLSDHQDSRRLAVATHVRCQLLSPEQQPCYSAVETGQVA